MDKIFTIEKIADMIVVDLLFAELSMEDAESLKESLYGYVTSSSKKFIIDLNKCVFFPSVALGVLVSLTAKVHAVNGRVVLCSPTKEVAAILEITKFGNIYDIYQTREEAIKSFDEAGTV